MIFGKDFIILISKLIVSYLKIVFEYNFEKKFSLPLTFMSTIEPINWLIVLI